MFRRPRPWLVLVVIWLVTLAVLSHQSHLHPPLPGILKIDKVQHTGYFTLGGFIFFSWLLARHPGTNLMRAAVLTVVFCSVVGALDELHQWFVPNRSGLDKWDWTADNLGGVLGATIGIWWRGRVSRQKAS
jgi:VanZ family protein